MEEIKKIKKYELFISEQYFFASPVCSSVHTFTQGDLAVQKCQIMTEGWRRKGREPQFYTQLVYKATLYFTLRNSNRE